MKHISIKLFSLIALLLSVAALLSACNDVEFKVDFIVDDEVYATVNTNGGETIKMPENPTKDDYTFDGWYWDKNTWERPFTANSLLDAPLSDDIEVHAKFSLSKPPHEHSFANYISNGDATYEADGTKTATCDHNGCNETDTKVDVGSILIHHALTFKTLTDKGENNIYGKVPNGTTTFSFLNEVTVNGTAEYGVYLDIICSQEVKSKTVNLATGDNTFYIWAENTDDGEVLYTVTIRVKPMYTVSFNTAGGTNVALQIVEEDAFATEPTTTQAGYTFVGWNYNFATPITKNTAVTASWTANEYTVTFNKNSGAGGSNTVTATFHAAMPAAAAPTKTGYTFVGYYDADNTQYYDAHMTSIRIWDKASTATLYAQWQANTYQITFDKTGGTGGSDTATAIFASAMPAATAPTKTGYTFIGYYDASDVKYYDATMTSVKPWDKASAATLYAKWQANGNTPYTVYHHQQNIEDDGYTLFETQPLTGTSDTSVTPSVKAYTGFTSPQTQTVTVNADGSREVHYYYIRNTYTVTFVTNGGDAIVPITKKYQADWGEPPDAVRAGFTFGGWYTDVALNNIADLTSATKNITIYSYWSEETKPSAFSYSGTTAISITKFLETATAVRIPSYIGGIPVTSISAFAFNYCTDLTNIIIPTNITTIGEGAFSGCSGLTNITIPFVGGSKKTAGDTYQYPFGYIFGTEIYNGGVETTQPYYSSPSSSISTTYYIPAMLKSVTVTGGDILYGAFYGCTGLTSVTIPNSVTNIGYSAFYGCTGLTSVTIPNSVISIGHSAFFNCKSLTNMTIPNSVEDIGDYAFSHCTRLTSVTLGRNITNIGEKAFTQCYKLVEVYNLSSLFIIKGSKEAGEVACYALNVHASADIISKVDSATFPGYTFYIDGTTRYLVDYTNSETDIALPTSYNGNTYQICKYAFYYCNITSITIPDNVTAIGDYAFYECTKLARITIGSSVTSIGSYAFYLCSDLTIITIPDSVTSIGQYAFSYCTSLANIIFADINTWYYSSNATNWANKIYGTEKNVTAPSTNATYFTDTYVDYYWYKK